MRRASFSRALAAVSLAVALTGSTTAFAGDTSTAEHLFEEGQKAMAKKDYAAACEAYAGSNEADPSPGTQINLALCSEKQGKLATAWGWYRTAAGLADQRGQKERADLARAEAAKLEPKLSKLVIRVKAPAEGLAIVRDGTAVPAAIVGKEVPVDPGEHAIEVTAKGKKAWKTKVAIAAAPGVTPVDVPALEDAPEDKAGPAAGPVGGDYRPPAGGSETSTQKTIGFVVGGAGIVALAVAGGFLIVNVAATKPALQDTREESNTAGCGTDGESGTKPPAQCQSFKDSIQSRTDARDLNDAVTIGAGIGGAVLLTTGIVLVLTAPSGARSGSLQKPFVLPAVGRGQVGGGLGFTF